MSIYSNDNISKIAKLTTRELPHLAKTAKITVRENNGVYSIVAILSTEGLHVVVQCMKLFQSIWMKHLVMFVCHKNPNNAFKKNARPPTMNANLLQHINLQTRVCFMNIMSLGYRIYMFTDYTVAKNYLFSFDVWQTDIMILGNVSVMFSFKNEWIILTLLLVQTLPITSS